MAQGNIELTWWPLFRDFVGNVLPLAVSFSTTCQQSEPAAGLHVLHLLAGSAGILHVQPDDCSLGGGPYDTEIVGCFAFTSLPVWVAMLCRPSFCFLYTWALTLRNMVEPCSCVRFLLRSFVEAT